MPIPVPKHETVGCNNTGRATECQNTQDVVCARTKASVSRVATFTECLFLAELRYTAALESISSGGIKGRRRPSVRDRNAHIGINQRTKIAGLVLDLRNCSLSPRVCVCYERVLLGGWHLKATLCCIVVEVLENEWMLLC